MRNYIFFAILILPLNAISQDTLVFKDGKKIPCKITKLDSSDVYFYFQKDYKTVSTYCGKTDLSDIIFYDPANDNTNNSKYNHIRNTLEVSVGISIPTGDFANDDVTSENSGLAGNGLNVNLIYSYFFNQHIGISFKGNYISNEYKTDKMGLSINNVPVSSNKVYYISYGILAGPTYNLPVNKFTLNGHLMMGIAILTQPQVTYGIETSNEIIVVKLEQVIANSIVYNAGIGLKYSINKNVDLISKIDYMNGSFKFDNYSKLTEVTTYAGTSSSSETIEGSTKKYDVVNISLGVCLKF
jgi:hypothetical protein